MLHDAVDDPQDLACANERDEPRIGDAAGTAAGSAIPGVGNVGGGLVGLFGGLGSGIALKRLLEPRIEEIATELVGADTNEMFYLMNRVEIDELGRSFDSTQIA